MPLTTRKLQNQNTRPLEDSARASRANAFLISAVDRLFSSFWFAVFVGILVNLLAYVVCGIRLGGDSATYLEQVDAISKHQPLSLGMPGYIGFISVLTFFDTILGSYRWLIFFQSLLSSVVLAALYFELLESLGSTARKQKATALVLLLMNPEIAYWNMYVLTDSLYATYLAALFWLGLRWVRTNRAVWLGSLVLASILMSFHRPTAVIVPVIVASFISARFLWNERQLQRSWIKAFGVLIVGLSISIGHYVTSVNQSVETYVAPAGRLRDGVYIGGHNPTRLRMPVFHLSFKRDNGILPVLAEMGEHPISCAKVILLRIFYGAIHIRPFWSFKHNIVSGFFFVFLWIFAVVAFARRHKDLVGLWLGAVLILSHLGIIALTFADYDGRFFFYVLPEMIFFAALGFIEYSSNRFRRALF